VDCSIIIPHYNQVGHLEVCLGALLDQQTDVEYEIIVIDVEGLGANALKPKVTNNKVKWISTEERNPYTSRNLGLRIATGETLILLDTKCQVTSGFIEAAIKAVTQNPTALMAGYYALNYRSEKIRDKVYGVLYLNTKKNVSKQYGVTAGNLAFSKNLVNHVGVFDDAHHSGMDILWSERIMTLGYKIEYASDMIVKYPAQNWEELKQSLKKYFCGISFIHEKKELGTASRLRYLVRYFFPMKMSTLRSSLESRSLDISPTDKVYLWLRVWQAKLYMAKAYLRCWMKHED